MPQSMTDEDTLFGQATPAITVLVDRLGCDVTTASGALRALIEAGYAIVPREPTESMLVAYLTTYVPPVTPSATIRGIIKARKRWKRMCEAVCAVAMSRRRL